MSGRTAVGVIFSVVGLMLLLYSGFRLNSLLFNGNLTSLSDIPSYNQLVVTPFLLGILALIDGSVILGLKRPSSLSLHLLGNIIWLYALYNLYENLSLPVTDISAYHQIFLLTFLGLIFFVVGVIINDAPRKKGS